MNRPADDGRGAGQQHQFHRDAEGGRLAHLEQQQGQEARGIDGNPSQFRPDPHVAVWRQDGQGEPVSSEDRSFF